jgi:carbon monoxide dehydrogenase subunit G
VPRFEFSVDIARAPADVFAYLTDITKLPEWQSGVVEATWVSPGRARQVRDFRGSRSESELRVTADELNRRFAIETLSGPVSLSLDVALQDSGGGTRLQVSGEGEPGGVAKVAGPIVARKIEKQFKSDFETLKRKLEAGG